MIPFEGLKLPPDTYSFLPPSVNVVLDMFSFNDVTDTVASPPFVTK